MIQESHSKKKGKHTFENFGGGSMMGVHSSLNRVLISSYENYFELTVVEAKVGNTEIRFIAGYGPQEDWSDDLKAPFFNALDQEISKDQTEPKSVYVAIDSNCKLGKEYIPNDPHNISKNGKILADIVERNALIVANGLPQCEGVITREMNTADGRHERSAINVVLVCMDLVDKVEHMKIDEDRFNVLTKITKNKKGEEKKNESDHNIVETDLNIEWNNSEPRQKVDMYNLKNEECQKRFKEYTNNSNMANIFESPKHLDVLTKKFLKHLNGAIVQCFKKIRVTKNPTNKLEGLYQKLNELKNKVDKDHQDEIEIVQGEIANEATKVVF